MSDVPVQLIIAAFQDENGAQDALNQLKEAKKARWIKIENAAVLRRDQNNKLHVSETADMGGGKGAVIGGVIGGVLGVLFPPSILVSAGLGAAIGGLAAKFSDGGFPDARLKEIGEALKPGTSAIIAVIDHVWVAEAEAELQAQGAQVFIDTLKGDISAQLEAGNEVGYSALAAGGAMVLDRSASGPEGSQAGELIITDEGVVGQRVMSDKEGTVAQAFVATDEGAVLATVTAPAEAPAGELPAEAPAAEAPAEAPAAEAPAEAPAADAEEKPAA